MSDSEVYTVKFKLLADKLIAHLYVANVT